MATKNNVVVRINPILAETIKKKTPGYNSWPSRLQFVYDNSLVKHSDKINLAGELIYGKLWQKIKKKK